MGINKNDRERNIENHDKILEELGEWFNKEKLGLFYFKSNVTKTHMFLGNTLKYSYIINQDGILGNGYIIVDKTFNKNIQGDNGLSYFEITVKIEDFKLWLLKEIVNE